jgi:hypothetical protein
MQSTQIAQDEPPMQLADVLFDVALQNDGGADAMSSAARLL